MFAFLTRLRTNLLAARCTRSGHVELPVAASPIDPATQTWTLQRTCARCGNVRVTGTNLPAHLHPTVERAVVATRPAPAILLPALGRRRKRRAA